MQRLSTVNAITVVPTLARIILCAAFLTMGWNKLMYTTEFTGEQARTLIELGVGDQQAGTATPAAYQDDADDAAGGDDSPLPDIPEPPDDVVIDDPQTGDQTVVAKRLHSVTLAVEGAGWSQPTLLGWATALTELIGGALLLVGLFSRVWGLGLAIVMGVAFYMTSLPVLGDMGLFGMVVNAGGDFSAYNRMFAQLGLLVLAFGVALTGPGPLSLDRLLFRPRNNAVGDVDEPV